MCVAFAGDDCRRQQQPDRRFHQLLLQSFLSVLLNITHTFNTSSTLRKHHSFSVKARLCHLQRPLLSGRPITITIQSRGNTLKLLPLLATPPLFTCRREEEPLGGHGGVAYFLAEVRSSEQFSPGVVSRGVKVLSVHFTSRLKRGALTGDRMDGLISSPQLRGSSPGWTRTRRSRLFTHTEFVQ